MTAFLDALFLCQSWIKGRKAEDEINSAIYSFAFKVMMIMMILMIRKLSW